MRGKYYQFHNIHYQMASQINRFMFSWFFFVYLKIFNCVYKMDIKTNMYELTSHWFNFVTVLSWSSSKLEIIVRITLEIGLLKFITKYSYLFQLVLGKYYQIHRNINWSPRSPDLSSIDFVFKYIWSFRFMGKKWILRQTLWLI